MSVGTPEAQPSADRVARIAVLLESGRAGEAALGRAAALAGELQAELTVVAVAPQATRTCCGGVSPAAYNETVRDQVAADLGRAVAELGVPARFELLSEAREPALPRFVSERAIELVLLPARHVALGSARHPQARRLRGLPGVEVRVITP
ncbi:MAG: hypothetical protein ACR2MK_11010 [Solirubrobacteraceae bacterium]